MIGMRGCLVHLPPEVYRCGEVKPHELEVAIEALDLLLLLLFEHGNCIAFNLGFQLQLITVFLIFLIPGVLQHRVSRLPVDKCPRGLVHPTPREVHTLPASACHLLFIIR
jgi:hypothetical protein